ncbi:MAG TPA: nuclear transport factor 2 family protein [Pyrinomonadaceae bacterium]|jgi:ketosteroid isomerase-like protein
MKYYATRIPAALITFVLGIASANLVGHVWEGSSDERDVLAVEREYVRAHVERDVAALDRALAEDFSMFGGRVRKSHRLALISSPFYAITSLKTDGVQVVVSGREAVVTGTARLSGSFRGREFNTPRYGYTRHLEKRGGRWQIVSCEFTVPW